MTAEEHAENMTADEHAENMTADERAEKAAEYFKAGYNCAQAVVLAFSDLIDMDEAQLKMLASSFGGGLGRLREVCGAVSGMAMVAGLLYGYASPKDDKAKAEHYALIQSLAEAFKVENGSIICRTLLGPEETENKSPVPEKRTEDYYKKRPCTELVKSGARILAETSAKINI